MPQFPTGQPSETQLCPAEPGTGPQALDQTSALFGDAGRDLCPLHRHTPEERGRTYHPLECRRRALESSALEDKVGTAWGKIVLIFRACPYLSLGKVQKVEEQAAGPMVFQQLQLATTTTKQNKTKTKKN